MKTSRTIWERLKAVFGLTKREDPNTSRGIVAPTEPPQGEDLIEPQLDQNNNKSTNLSSEIRRIDHLVKDQIPPVDETSVLITQALIAEPSQETADHSHSHGCLVTAPLCNKVEKETIRRVETNTLLDESRTRAYQDPYRKWAESTSLFTSPAVDLVIGIDFGTSCSKVVIGDPNWKNRSYPVRFGHGYDDISEYLLPTRFGEEINLKMRLMKNPVSEPLKDVIACYFAVIIFKACECFWKTGPVEYQSRVVHWSLNIGFPRKTEADSPYLGKVYREVAYLAVKLASQTNSPSPMLAEKIRTNGIGFDSFLPEKRINIYPEIAAQLAGYITSAQRRSGPILLMDVGAGTLDVSTLILHEDLDEQVLSFHCCDVRDLGVLRYYETITSALNQCCPGSVIYAMEYYQDGLKRVPEQLEKIVHFVDPSIKVSFKKANDEFRMDVLNQAFGSLWRFRNRLKDANANRKHDPWGRSLRVFLTGGGSRSVFFTNCLSVDLEQEVAKRARCWDDDPARRKRLDQGFRVEQLPAPTSSMFPGFPQHLKRDFDRLSVAYGLAFGGQNLMRITSTVTE